MPSDSMALSRMSEVGLDRETLKLGWLDQQRPQLLWLGLDDKSCCADV